ncbi:hypothetical protein K440DRAFT_537551 [Wilcoxina mikolae CBS 423.85]|nr:hypothetical protein K440DRAFT_537551 [Wilcoxina mikolae CBS 423.85]
MTTVEHPGWHTEPETRGTASILFSCTTTLGLCVWTALHLNIEPAAKTKMTLASRFLAKAIWAFTALIAPELVLSIALHQFLVAWKYRSIVNENYCGKNGEKITLKKAFYAVMGGFSFKMTDTNTVTLEVEMLVKEGAIEKIRRYPIAAIDDKSKADYLAKVLACFQASWILLQCLGRKIDHLPSTLLELNTVVHVLNAVIMYGLWWEKPVDVGEPSIIDQFNDHEESEKKTAFVGVDVLQKRLLEDLGELQPAYGFGTRWCVRHRLILLAFSGCTGVFYGGMHSIKWHDTFPSHAEKSLWRLSSLVGVVGLFPIMAFSFLNFTHHRLLFFFLMFIGVVSAPLFILARSYLIVESFISMRSLPDGAYKTVDWAEVIPHI